MKKGYFFAIEGVDGAGKTSVAKKVVEILRKEDIDAVYTREPGGTKIETAEKIRKFIFDNTEMLDRYTQAFLFAAARREHLIKFIEPSLKEKKVVISDRFLDSSLAYQGLNEKKATCKIKKINEMVMDKINPDKTFLLSVNYKIGLERIKKNKSRATNGYDKKKPEYYELVSAAFKTICEKNPKQYEIIDAGRKKDQVFQDVYEKIKTIINDKS